MRDAGQPRKEGRGMHARRIGQVIMGTGVVLTLQACQDGSAFPFLKGSPSPKAQTTVLPAADAGAEDIEAPDVFSVDDEGLWDGRPSLGGIWVAHPDVKDPERVRIRNDENGETVTGALFRRERDNPGPALQVSSEAAAALGMLAGNPTAMTVVALRRAEPSASTAAKAPAPATPEPGDGKPGDAPAMSPAKIAVPASAPLPRAATDATGPAIDRSYIQVGIYTVEAHARAAETSLRDAGVVPGIRTERRGLRRFWRVLVGPSDSAAERAALMEKIKALGYDDAYVVTR